MALLSLRTLLRELLGLSRAFAAHSCARLDIFDWIETFYKRTRFHNAIDLKSPVDFETQLNGAFLNQ